MRKIQSTPLTTARVSLPRSATSIGPPPRTEQWIEHRPLGVGKVHVLDLRCSA